MTADDPRPPASNGASPLHPHQPAVAPIYDPEGRCLVCGCLWRDEQIARCDATIAALIDELRYHDPDCPMLPENAEENEGWISEAHRFPPADWDENDHGRVGK